MTFAKDLTTKFEGRESEIVATAFRDDRTAELVTVTDLSFDGCTILSEAGFATGERLRLHIRKQGWIEAHVQSASDGRASILFNTHCRV